jgi:hypothetical protein
MGAINPSKMPGKRVVKRTDNPDAVDMYSEGGDVKFNLGSVNYDKGNLGASGKITAEKKLAELMPDAPKALRDAVLKAYISGDINLNKQGLKGLPTTAGIGFSLPFAEGGGLYDNINAKRKRIAEGSGEKMRKPGSKGAPTAEAFKQSAKTAKR